MPINRRQYLKMMTGAIATASVLPACSPSVHSARFKASGNSTELFLQLSSILTGELVTQLDTSLALEYMARLQKRNPGVLELLLAKFQSILYRAKGNQAKIIKLVDEEIWQQGCLQINIGGTSVCDAVANPECCMARDIALLWYAGAVMVLSPYQSPSTLFAFGSAKSYLSALAWQIAGAHPQAQCGGTYGYWSSKPGKAHSTEG